MKNPLKHQGANVGTTDTAVNARIVDKVPKTDCKYPTGGGDNAGSGGMDSVGEEKEDELDTLEKEYNQEYYVDSDGLQQYDNENCTSESVDMTFGSDTDGSNRYGSARMGRWRSLG